MKTFIGYRIFGYTSEGNLEQVVETGINIKGFTKRIAKKYVKSKSPIVKTVKVYRDEKTIQNV